MLVTVAEFAKDRDVSRQAVYKAIHAGRIQAISGKIDLEQGREAWAANTDLTRDSNSVTGNPAGARPKSPTGGARPRTDAPREPANTSKAANTFNQARGLKIAWEAKSARLQYEKEAGILVIAEEVERRLSRNVRMTRDAILSITDRVAAKMAAESDEARIREVLDNEFRRALEALADGFSNRPSPG